MKVALMLVSLLLAVACTSTADDAIVREHAEKYAACVNTAVDEALAGEQNRLVVENRIVRECYPIYISLNRHHGVSMESGLFMDDAGHKNDVWFEIVDPAEQRVKTVPLPDPKCRLMHVQKCPPEQD